MSWPLLALLAFAAIAFFIYGSRRTFAWRYLFPGVAAMLAFVALPLAYTVAISFSNYSSNNLLSEERARQYLLEQAEVDETQAYAFTLHERADQLHLRLTAPGDGAHQFLSAPLGSGQANVSMQPLAGPPLGPPLTLKQVITQRERLMALNPQLPDGRTLAYAGLREYAPYQPLWREAAAGALTEAASGKLFTPNPNTGYFENTTGQRLQPGFKVGVGLAHFARLFGDADLRGPFISIFIWTLLFALLTVLFSASIGMALAVLLNWEGLRHRTLYRTLLFLPYAVPGFISILVFKGLFNQSFGEINALLNAAFAVKPAWFAEPLLAKVMILIVNTWLGYPYFMVLCTGLIKAIPADLYEASAIAGAGPLTNFFKITAPLVIKPLTPLLISAFAFNFNNFVLISLLTDGRPDFLNTKLPAGTTDILVSYTYRIAFTDAGQNFGLAAAISTLIFLLVAVLSPVNLKLSNTNVSNKA